MSSSRRRTTSARSRPPPRGTHVVGAWPNTTDAGNAGGWQLWSNGRVAPLKKAPFYGDARRAGVNDIVGMIGDELGSGYWLIAANGKVYSYGSVGQDQYFAAPAHAPTSGVVGAINLLNFGTEGFDMVTARGAAFPFVCKFKF